MKTKILKLSFFSAILGIALWSCKKDEIGPSNSNYSQNLSQMNVLDKSTWIDKMGSHHNASLAHINQNLTINNSVTNGMNINEFNDYFDVIATEKYSNFSQNTFFQVSGTVEASKPTMTNNLSHTDMILFQKNSLLSIKNQFVNYKSNIETISSRTDYNLSIEILNLALNYLDNPTNSQEYIDGLNNIKDNWNTKGFENSSANDGIFSASLLGVGIYSYSYWSNNISFLQGTTFDSDYGDVIPALPWMVNWDLAGVAGGLWGTAAQQAFTGEDPSTSSIIWNVVSSAVMTSVGGKYIKAARQFLGW